MLPGSWGEDFVPVSQFPKSFCVMVGTREGDPNFIKPYTPIDWSPSHMDLLVKTYPLGRISKALFESKEGGIILLKGPREKLNLPNLFSEHRRPKRIIAIAGGTGIAPIYQLLKYIESSDHPSTPVNLIYANKSPEDILLLPQLTSLKLPNLSIKHVLESESGYIKAEDIVPAEGDGNDYVVLCGPKGFRDVLLGSAEAKAPGLLQKLSYTPNQIYQF